MEELVKGGICWLETTLDFKPGESAGIEFYAKVEPRIEGLIRQASSGTSDLPIGTNWIPLKGQSLRYYTPTKAFDGFASISESIGDPLRDGRGRINLSFLRLVGIGEAGGVRFRLDGPGSVKMARELSKDIPEAVRHFVRSYMLPAHIELRLTSKEF